jgi:hypothetical protein
LAVNIDRILGVFNAHGVQYLLIGGMNFVLRHAPMMVTVDIDFWVEDSTDNLHRCEAALAELGAEWGASDDDWRLVTQRKPGWLSQQAVFSLNSAAGPIDIFRAVRGLSAWQECRLRSQGGTTTGGTPFVALSDADMLACQLALPE